jgi:hypothetical protein
MKTLSTVLAALAVASTAFATPSPAQQLAPRATSATPVTVKGNGKITLNGVAGPAINTFQLSTRVAIDSMSVGLTTSREDHRNLSIPLQIAVPPRANVISLSL